jgi:DNA replication protein DnaC
MKEELSRKLQQLCLGAFAARHTEMAERCEQDNKSFIEYLEALTDIEIETRYHKRIGRFLKQAKLPRTKTIDTFDHKRIPGLSLTKLKALVSGDFIDRCENLLVFGNPGTGKTHLAIALAQEWCMSGRRVYFTTAAQLIQELLKAKAELALNKLSKKLDRFEVLIIDDISYISCDRKETDVLFNLLADRYEMRSILITSNLPFAKWDVIFKDQMTTTAAIDRLVHHSTILELNTESYRVSAAKNNLKKGEKQ